MHCDVCLTVMRIVLIKLTERLDHSTGNVGFERISVNTVSNLPNIPKTTETKDRIQSFQVVFLIIHILTVGLGHQERARKKILEG